MATEMCCEIYFLIETLRKRICGMSTDMSDEDIFVDKSFSTNDAFKSVLFCMDTSMWGESSYLAERLTRRRIFK